MRRALSFIAVAILFGGFQPGTSLQAPVAELAAQPTIAVDQLCLGSETTPAKRGCCSHHKGVCGCKDGRDVCCDGEFSPTCTCHE